MNDIEIGKIIEFSKTFTDSDVRSFAQISEDDNPIHLDDEYASNSIFGKRIVHGILVTSIFSKVFGTIYPGQGCIYLSQSSQFIKPVFIGEQILARITLQSFDEARNQGIFLTECIKSDGSIAVKGEAKILFPKKGNHEI